MLRRDAGAHFEQFGLFRNKYSYVYAKRQSATIGSREYHDIIGTQQVEPVLMVDDPELGRRWWLFQGVSYWEDQGLSPREFRALILERQARTQNRVELAVAKMDGVATSREPVTRDVQTLVWQRDGGKCVRCGSQNRLEFDHIIPVSKGGSSSARNLQLLCERCNRAKGTQIG